MTPGVSIYRDAVERAPDLVHRVRGLRYFTRHLKRGIAGIGAREGVSATVDETTAARVFLEWVDEVNRQKQAAASDRRDYTIFSAGLLLRRLLAGDVIRVHRPAARTPASPAVAAAAEAAPPTAEDAGHPLLEIWPEGYIATVYCLTVLDVVLAQEGMEGIRLTPEAGDVRTWWSFKENCKAMPSLAVPFLDSFLGNEPNWTFPTDARARTHQTLIA